MRGRQNRGRTTPAFGRRGLNALKSALHGHENRLQFKYPPEFNSRPFQNLTIEIPVTFGSSNTKAKITPVDVVTQLVTQLGILSSVPTADRPAFLAKFAFKIRRADLYTIPTGSSGQVPTNEMRCSSLVPGGSVLDPAQTTETPVISYPILKILRDSGGLSEAAITSYTWPSHMADIPITTATPFVLIECSGNTPSTDGNKLRLHISWSANGPSDAPDAPV